MVAFIPKIGLMVTFIPKIALMATIRFTATRVQAKALPVAILGRPNGSWRCIVAEA